MDQKYKNVYFRDLRSEGRKKVSLTLAFGKDDQPLYESLHQLSSDDFRRALGFDSFRDLKAAAVSEEKTINAYCLRLLRDRTRPSDSQEPSLPGFEEEHGAFVMDPLQATFRGGQHEPLHNWYPYLEGYSPAFVESVYRKFCRGATSILDPFGGTGTTPLTTSTLGLRSFYCEINPLLQFLTESKTVARELRESKRSLVTDGLHDLADTLEAKLDASASDPFLQASYLRVFGDSKFFEPMVLRDILKLRSLVDSIACDDLVIARFLTVAALASLIPVSRLIRRGDLRFKTEAELSRGSANLKAAVCDTLRLIARDITGLKPSGNEPLLLLEDAKNLQQLAPLEVDAVITSPPYLNGTNYFRNTKIELWFLRCLKSKADLAAFRFNSMTVGINDVTVKKEVGHISSIAREAVEALQKQAYDSRIARMVGRYASEMESVLGGLCHHVTERGTIAIDIGDSAYAGVHVPTDKMIEASLASYGWEIVQDVVLRRRLSRSGFPLHQKLLIFKSSSNRTAKRAPQPRAEPRTWQARWTDFKMNLPHQRGDYAKRNWGHPLHSLCSYQGKMKPSLAAFLVETFTTPGDRLLDPFSGVGTIPFEAALRGVESWGFDISPPAVQITAAKVGRCDRQACLTLIEKLERRLRGSQALKQDYSDALDIRFNGPLRDYFHPETFREVLAVRRYFLDKPPQDASESLVYACLLHILHGNRPYALTRRSHPITPFAPSGPVERRHLIPRLRDKVERSFVTPMPDTYCIGHALYQDATAWWPTQIQELDAVITSPPFFDSTRFYLGNWMRLWFAGWTRVDFARRPKQFVDERQKLSFDVYRSVFRQTRERLKAGGVAVFHLGASKKCDMAEALMSIAQRWFRVVDIYTENVSHCESHGIRDKGTVVSHQYMVLE
jgi:tRNA G10  N-methylase Trm11